MSLLVVSLKGTLGCGAVSAVKEISNPISLARMVMEKTSHVMLTGEGANRFAAEMGVAKVETSELACSAVAKKEWEKFDKYGSIVSTFYNVETSSPQDTVGAVALDFHGNIAAATSTGGISLKKVGRVGDSPMIGSGAYADNNIGGVSCTGHGESIAKVVLAHRALSRLDYGLAEDLEQTLKDSLEYMLERVGGHGGMIAISKTGKIAKYCTTPRMSWASMDESGILKSGL